MPSDADIEAPDDGLGPLERRVMGVAWSADGTVTVRDVAEVLGGDLAYTTVMTTLDRLHKKGLLARVRDGRAFAYAPRRSRAEVVRERAAALLRRLLRAEPAPVLSCIVDAVGEPDAKMLDELQRLIEQRRRTRP